jgi:diaminopimelate decarboxylase
MSHIQYFNATLHIESHSIEQLATQYATPFYCYSANAIRQQYRSFTTALGGLPALVCYALKVNSNQAVLKILANEGAGADVVSQGELCRALAAGIPAQKIVYSGVAKTTPEIRFALQQNILCFNVESEAELRNISNIANDLNLVATISLRINPDVDAGTHAKISTGKSENKFGIPYKKAVATYQLAKQLAAINIAGIDMHIGSQIQQVSAFDAAIARLVDLIEQLKALDIPIKHIDFGGGLGVAYQQSDSSEAVLLAQYAAIIHKYSKQLNCQLIFEPGRFITANAGLLVTKVVYTKPVEHKSFIMVDAAMNDLIRPTLYDAWHHIGPVKEPIDKQIQIVDVVGPVCESGDYLALDREMPIVQAGELLVVYSAGAYGAVTANTYNTRRLIAEVLVDGENHQQIRRSPTVEEIIDLDHVPNWL